MWFAPTKFFSLSVRPGGRIDVPSTEYIGIYEVPQNIAETHAGHTLLNPQAASNYAKAKKKKRFPRVDLQSIPLQVCQNHTFVHTNCENNHCQKPDKPHGWKLVIVLSKSSVHSVHIQLKCSHSAYSSCLCFSNWPNMVCDQKVCWVLRYQLRRSTQDHCFEFHLPTYQSKDHLFEPRQFCVACHCNLVFYLAETMYFCNEMLG